MIRTHYATWVRLLPICPGRTKLPPADPGCRYLDFAGGEKELRCFIVPEEMPRCQFMEEHSDLLDESLTPIYDNNGICIRQDASYSLPGFYIASLKKHYTAMDKMDAVTHLRMSFILRQLRLGMREALNIEFLHMYYEEKPDKSFNVHYWMLPVFDPETKTSPVIVRLDLKKYLSQFHFRDQREKICTYNQKMLNYFQVIGLPEKDNELTNKLSSLEVGVSEPSFVNSF